jgi:hypothetical protein
MNDTAVPAYTLISYSRNKKGDPIGVLVAKKRGNNGDFTIGYSQCRKGDKFSKKMGLKIALGRCDTGSFGGLDSMPHNLRRNLSSFVQRCEKYYKVGVKV